MHAPLSSGAALRGPPPRGSMLHTTRRPRPRVVLACTETVHRAWAFPMSEPSTRTLAERYRAALALGDVGEARTILDTICVRTIRGDREAFEVLHRHFNGVVLASLTRSGARGADAQEVAATAWERTWRRCASGQLTELRVPGYVVTAARRALLDRYKIQHRYAPLDDADSALLAPAGDSPDAHIQVRRIQRVLGEVLAAQPAGNQALLRAIHLEGRGITESGAMHAPDRSNAAVRMVVMRFRKQLRVALAEVGIDTGGDDDGEN